MTLAKEIESSITHYLNNDLGFPDDGNVVCDGDIPNLLMYSFAIFNRGSILRKAVHITITDHRISIICGTDRQSANGIILYSESYRRNIVDLLKKDIELIMSCVRYGYTVLSDYIKENNSKIIDAENKLIEKFNNSESNLGTIYVTCTEGELSSISYLYLTKENERAN